MKVFISSTFVDLIEHRKAVVDALERLGTPVGKMEVFGARPEGAEEACLKETEECDIFVGVYAHRYGYVPPNSEVSITEQELEHAVHQGKTIFCFIVDDNHPWPPKLVEGEPGKTKLQGLIARIKPKYVVDTFTGPENLGMKVSTSIARYLSEQQKTTSKEIKTKLQIRAPAKKIWALIASTEQLPVWLPNLGKCEGKFQQGAYLLTKDKFIHLIESKLYLLKVEPEQEIRIIRYPPFLGTRWFKREYILSVEAIDDNSVFIVSREIFQGHLMKLIQIFWTGEIIRSRTHLMEVRLKQLEDNQLE